MRLTTRNATASNEESYVTSVVQRLNTLFVSKGVPVLMGEFGAIRRTGTSGLAGADLDLHLASRTYFDQYVVAQANSLGVRPVYWDDGDNGSGNNAFGIFNRSTAALTRPDDARALTGGAALPPPATASGYYRLTPMNATSMALDVNGVSTADGANVQLWSYTGGYNQQWSFQAR